MKNVIIKIVRITLLLLLGYLLIGMAIILIEERLSVFEDEQELEFEQADILVGRPSKGD